jgi:hypothetical protein
MLRTVLLAATFVAIVAAAQFAPTPATAQTVPPAKGCACEIDDRPEPALCPRHYLPFISR